LSHLREEAITTTTTEIAELKLKLEQEKIKRQNLEEYDKIRKLVHQFPSRQQTGEEIAKLRVEIDVLEKESTEITATLDLRSKQFQMLLHIINDLQLSIQPLSPQPQSPQSPGQRPLSPQPPQAQSPQSPQTPQTPTTTPTSTSTSTSTQKPQPQKQSTPTQTVKTSQPKTASASASTTTTTQPKGQPKPPPQAGSKQQQQPSDKHQREKEDPKLQKEQVGEADAVMDTTLSGKKRPIQSKKEDKSDKKLKTEESPT